MWEKIRVVFTIPELRKKILFTLGLLAVYRVGWQIPLPIVDQAKMTAFFESGRASLGRRCSNTVAMFSAAQLNQVTIFGLGIMPYISASIIFQLLGSVWGPLERLQKGRRERPQEDQRIHPLRHGRVVHRAKLGLHGLLMANPATAGDRRSVPQ